MVMMAVPVALASASYLNILQLGDEMEPTMPGISIISKRYLAGGGLTGTVALIGPSRMNFRKLIPIMDYFSTKLGQCMSGKNQEALE